MAKFLNFWTHYNPTIIEVLVGLILLTVIIFVYRMIFIKSAASSDGVHINTESIEKTLQKILETTATKENKTDSSKPSVGGADPAVVEQRVQELQKILSEKQKQIENLQKEVEAASASAAAAPAADAAAGTGDWAAEKAELQKKIRDLEARLAEYEIIGDDIADLSKYKAENVQLLKEIEQLKSAAGGGGAPAAAAPVSATTKNDTAAAPAADAPTPVAAPAEASAAPASPAAEEGSVIDDYIMKEFAAAVEQQKAATGKAP